MLPFPGRIAVSIKGSETKFFCLSDTNNILYAIS